MLILPDPRPLAALTRPGLMAFVAAVSAVLVLEGLRRAGQERNPDLEFIREQLAGIIPARWRAGRSS